MSAYICENMYLNIKMSIKATCIEEMEENPLKILAGRCLRKKNNVKVNKLKPENHSKSCRWADLSCLKLGEPINTFSIEFASIGTNNGPLKSGLDQ